MSKPPYMRFVPDDYLADTEDLELEEQGAYMRLLCKMWKRSGRIPNDDKEIARMLGVHTNKWTKIKPFVMPFFREHSPGFLTQKRLQIEYRYSVDKLAGKENTPPDTGGVTPDVTPQDTYGVTRGDTHHDTPLVLEGENEQNQGENESRHENSARERLDLEESSRSLNHINNIKRLEEDGGVGIGGKLTPEKLADVFIEDMQRLFVEFNLPMPRDHSILSGWLADDIHPFRHILPAVKKVLARLSAGTADPPKSWKYFAREVYRKQKTTGGRNGKEKR